MDHVQARRRRGWALVLTPWGQHTTLTTANCVGVLCPRWGREALERPVGFLMLLLGHKHSASWEDHPTPEARPWRDLRGCPITTCM